MGGLLHLTGGAHLHTLVQCQLGVAQDACSRHQGSGGSRGAALGPPVPLLHRTQSELVFYVQQQLGSLATTRGPHSVSVSAPRTDVDAELCVNLSFAFCKLGILTVMIS